MNHPCANLFSLFVFSSLDPKFMPPQSVPRGTFSARCSVATISDHHDPRYCQVKQPRCKITQTAAYSADKHLRFPIPPPPLPSRDHQPLGSGSTSGFLSATATSPSPMRRFEDGASSSVRLAPTTCVVRVPDPVTDGAWMKCSSVSTDAHVTSGVW